MPVSGSIFTGQAATRGQIQVKYTNTVMPGCLALLLTACGGGGGGSTGGITPPPPPPVVNSLCATPVISTGNASFVQTTEALGLCYAIDVLEPATEVQVMGGGLAMSDIDHDGFPELYVAHGVDQKGRLFSYDGTIFQPVTDNAGIQPSSVDAAGYFFDLNADGWDDFLSIQYGINTVEVFFNDGTGQFAENTAATNIYVGKSTFSIAAADYDLDGDLDLFMAHWGAVWDENGPLVGVLWENDGNGWFTDRSSIVEIIPTFRPPPFDDFLAEHGFTPTFSDINGDGYPDILLAGDFESSQVLINDAGTAFVDATTAAISDENGMGAGVIDIDHDGDFDWFVSSIWFSGRDKEYAGGTSGNRLYRNDGSGNFTDITDAAGVRDGDWGWGSCFADFNNDGHPDIFHTNGMTTLTARDNDLTHPLYTFFKDPSRLFMANGDGTFSEQANALGINHVAQGRGIICADYDNDGRVDILIANNRDSPTVYRNQVASANNWLKIDLEGQTNNRRGIGAKVSVQTSSHTQSREVVMGSNYLSQSPATLHFGLGSDSTADVIVRWPDGTLTTVNAVASDQRITVAHPTP